MANTTKKSDRPRYRAAVSESIVNYKTKSTKQERNVQRTNRQPLPVKSKRKF